MPHITTPRPAAGLHRQSRERVRPGRAGHSDAGSPRGASLLAARGGETARVALIPDGSAHR